MRYFVVPAMIAALVLSGCATDPKRQVLSSDVIDTIRSEGLNFKPPSDANFLTQTKGKIVALTALSVVGAAMGGGGSVHLGQRNSMPKGGYLDADAWLLSPTVEGAGVFKDPGKAMDVSVRDRLAQKGIVHNPDASYAIIGSADFWGLDYEKLTESDNYRLYFNLTLTLKRGMFFQRSVSCAGASLEKHGYDDWMAGDRERIHRPAAVIGDSCASRLLAELDLAGEEPVPLVGEADG
ncbi:hypothetical protein FIV34_19405 [Luteibacter pinisoli]|uniref:Lipoprotein n=1 Tax=Luteibacter pinisoli TaxID=2589080 RepID=A0A4Y5Z6W3_9GAMM|nr:hypothetical protein [Luteibacter pinisoli]QDE41212.1 hypothetical protein FIV34_19405 [Luteibacter pinisoli]